MYLAAQELHVKSYVYTNTNDIQVAVHEPHRAL
jgi:hypothetical protein